MFFAAILEIFQYRPEKSTAAMIGLDIPADALREVLKMLKDLLI